MSDFTNIITDEMKQLHADAITEVVRGCAVPCTLVYGNTKVTDCPNCIYDPALGRSSNVYQAGGPIPFTGGVCPVCYGAGKFVEDVTSTANLCIIYDYKSWYPLGVEINSPYGYVQSLSLLETMDEIKEAKELIANTNLETYVRQRFERYSEPQPCGFGQATIIATMWKRIEN